MSCAILCVNRLNEMSGKNTNDGLIDDVTNYYDMI